MRRSAVAARSTAAKARAAAVGSEACRQYPPLTAFRQVVFTGRLRHSGDMNAAERGSQTQLPDLDTLDVASLKALVLAKQAELESLKLLIVKLKRMQFGPGWRSTIAISNSSSCGWKIWKPTRRRPSRLPRAHYCGIEADGSTETGTSSPACGTAAPD